MTSTSHAPQHPTALRATLSGDGCLGPIEERIGRRLIRTVDPESKEGRALLGSGQVDLIGPDGNHLGCISPAEACRLLHERLERRLADPRSDLERDALRDGLARLEVRAERIGHG